MILRLDCCGLLCTLLVYFCMCYANYAVIFWMVLPTFTSFYSFFHITSFAILSFLAILSHLRTMLTDPGVVPICRNADNPQKREQADDEDDYDSGSDYDFVTRKKHFVGEDWTICSRCESYRPPRAHHCRICKRCIRKMDHHCPWVNNCVGEFNQKYFLQFVFYVGILALYAVGIVVLSWIYHDENSTTGQNGPNGELARHYKVIHTVCLSIEASLLGLFVLAVSCDQLQAIFNDETIIEAIQRRTINRRRQLRHGKWALLRAVCGERHWSLWALPCFSLTHRRDFVHFAKPFKDLSV
ncbi:Palmitoyltransferase [Aphelenchoides besseyi]|nr:Palmitoyltransferase [Aphelenchoides besseyi]